MNQLYHLRSNFAIIGLTGRTGAGCSTIANKLSDENYIKVAKENFTQQETNDTSKLKFDICLNYLSYDQNWQPFHVIKYSHVLFYQLLYEAFKERKNEEEALSFLISVVCPEINYKDKRFCKRHEQFETIKDILKQTIEFTLPIFESYVCDTLEICLRGKESVFSDFFQNIDHLAEQFFKICRSIDPTKTNLLLQDLSCNLRSSGSVQYTNTELDHSIDNIYIIAETINRLIKVFRDNVGHGRIVIDSLKNSLELTYFKERYAAFYCIATNKLEEERKDYKRERLEQLGCEDIEYHLNQLLHIDNTEYKGSEVKKGEFSSPDIENCIQKSEYHIFYTEKFEKYKHLLIGEDEISVNLDVQLIKFISLLFHPGIITPTAQERSMQVAYNAKNNSGCISRQVGAVVTDRNHSIKAIGWNDVAKNQVPCNLRSLKDLIAGRNKDHFSEFELGQKDNYKDGLNFKQKVQKNIDLSKIDDKLQGRNCSFCFKTCHNSFEGESNQVHTRSLHAEENAMLQITKYGGQGVEGGYLYTTASPCELCSKKAFQLGIKTIFFIDPYPGIATSHILKSAKDPCDNPKLLMFRGAVGRGFHKLFEPFTSYKDEINVRANLHPKVSQKTIISKLTKSKSKQLRIRQILEEE